MLTETIHWALHDIINRAHFGYHVNGVLTGDCKVLESHLITILSFVWLHCKMSRISSTFKKTKEAGATKGIHLNWNINMCSKYVLHSEVSVELWNFSDYVKPSRPNSQQKLAIDRNISKALDNLVVSCMIIFDFRIKCSLKPPRPPRAGILCPGLIIDQASRYCPSPFPQQRC